jgi:hypothetical protein
VLSAYDKSRIGLSTFRLTDDGKQKVFGIDRHAKNQDETCSDAGRSGALRRVASRELMRHDHFSRPMKGLDI